MRDIAKSDVVLGDETTVRLQKSTSKGWMWTFLSPAVVGYRFSASRLGATPQEVLDGSIGLLVADDYTGSNHVCTPDHCERPESSEAMSTWCCARPGARLRWRSYGPGSRSKSRGGQNLAMIYSLVSTCELHELNPEDYLADVPISIQTHPANRIDELLPHNWKMID